MFPYIEVFGWFNLYTFGLTLTICFFLYLWMLKKLCHRFGINNSFFFNRILWYFVSVFIFSRVFYVIANWDNFKYIKEPLEFFLMSDYNFSLIGAIFGYLLVLFINIIVHGLRSGKYMDVSVLSFLFASVFGYIGAFLGGQVYGNQTDFGIEIMYNSAISNIPYEVPVFPLAIVYSILFFILFSILFMLSSFVKVRGIIGYFGLIIFSLDLLVFEYFSGKYDYFKTNFGLNFTQIGAIGLILFSIFGLYRIYRMPTKSDILS